jgi:hypothetical protein
MSAEPSASAVPTFRAGAPASASAGPELGPLKELPGTWIGSGFNLIARPDFQGGAPFFLELNATRETLNFTAIEGPIPNRGSLQDDIEFLGVHYLQQVSDAVTLGGLHIEPGIWLNVPVTTDPAVSASVVRLATIPHGDALLAQGNSLMVQGGPEIKPADSTPIHHATQEPVTNPEYLEPFKTTPLPRDIPAGAIANPNVVLEAAIEGQQITSTTVLIVSTTTELGGSAGGIENIPFVAKNANALSMEATFWIEMVTHQGFPGRQFLQLQYTQKVMLSFLGIDWPHISVATLVKN